MQYHPIHEIPVELLREIFLQCIPEANEDRPRDFQPPLTEVCRLWRLVSLATPQLWTNIQVNIPQECHCPPRRHPIYGAEGTTDDIVRPTNADITHAKLQRVRHHPVDITVNLPLPCFKAWSCPNRVSDPTSDVINALRSYSAQWRNVSFKKIQSENFKIILNIPSSDLPLLESLEASVMDSLYPIDAMTWSNSTVLQAPRLRRIKLAGSILCDISILRVDWKRITSFTIWENTVVSGTSLFGVLLECETLEELNLHVLFTPPFPQSPTLPTLRLTNLKRLCVTENASDASLESFYAALGDLPSLHTLIFNQNPYQKLIAPDAPLAIYDLISATEKTLRRLQVDPRLMSKAGLTGCLQRGFRITYLSFMQGPPNLYISSRQAAIVDDELLRALLSMRDLECFSCAVPPRFTDRELVSIIRGRSQSKLKKIFVAFNGSPKVQVDEIQEEFNREELSLDLRYNTVGI